LEFNQHSGISHRGDGKGKKSDMVAAAVTCSKKALWFEDFSEYATTGLQMPFLAIFP
jgi:hypothetical protein